MFPVCISLTKSIGVINDGAECHLNYQLFPISLSMNLSALKEKAEAGDLDAQCDLGLMYANGENIRQDYKQALYW